MQLQFDQHSDLKTCLLRQQRYSVHELRLGYVSLRQHIGQLHLHILPSLKQHQA